MKRSIAIISNTDPKQFMVPVQFKLFRWNRLDTDINLRDFDAVVIDIQDINIDLVDWSIFQEVLNTHVALDVMKNSKSYILVIGNPNFEYYEDLDYSPFMDWSPFEFDWVKGSGNSIKIASSASRSLLNTYIQKTKKYQTSYSNASIKSAVPYNSNKFSIRPVHRQLVINKPEYTVSSEVWIEKTEKTYPNTAGRLFNGSLLLIQPVYVEAHKNINEVVTLLETSENSKEPDWLADISVFGQEYIDKQISSEKTKMLDAENKLNTLTVEREKLRDTLKLLYLKGKSLEPVTEEAFKEIGGTTLKPEEDSNVEYHLFYKKHKFAVEVKSTDSEHIDKKGLRQAVDWANDAFDETGEEYKPLVVVSNLMKSPVQERNKSPLPPNLVEYANKKNICVITAKTLFDIHQAIKKSETQVDQFFNNLSSTKGLFTGSESSSKDRDGSIGSGQKQ